MQGLKAVVIIIGIPIIITVMEIVKKNQGSGLIITWTPLERAQEHERSLSTYDAGFVGFRGTEQPRRMQHSACVTLGIQVSK